MRCKGPTASTHSCADNVGTVQSADLDLEDHSLLDWQLKMQGCKRPMACIDSCADNTSTVKLPELSFEPMTKPMIEHKEQQETQCALHMAVSLNSKAGQAQENEMDKTRRRSM